MLSRQPAMLALMTGPLRIGHVTFGVHTLLYAAITIALGYQSVTFALFTKVFAITEGFLPEDPWLARAFRHVTLETGLIAGALQIALGVVGGVAALWWWRSTGFGALESSRTMRVFIPAVMLGITGSQTVLASFFLSILGLRRRLL